MGGAPAVVAAHEPQGGHYGEHAGLPPRLIRARRALNAAKEGEEKENEEAGPHHADFLGGIT